MSVYYKKAETRLKHDKARYEVVKEIVDLENELARISPLDPTYGEKLKRYDLLTKQVILYDREMGYNLWKK